jgi:acetyl-CoA synthetase
LRFHHGRCFGVDTWWQTENGGFLCSTVPAVIPARDEIKGKVPDLKPGHRPSEDIRKRVEDSVVREIGPIARPRRIRIVPDMPKTRSGKIMRHVLAAISNNEDAGDISTLRGR